MKVVNPIGRDIKALETGSNFGSINPLWGCICSGSVSVANSYNLGPGWCVGYCESGTINRDANKDVAKVAN